MKLVFFLYNKLSNNMLDDSMIVSFKCWVERIMYSFYENVLVIFFCVLRYNKLFCGRTNGSQISWIYTVAD